MYNQLNKSSGDKGMSTLTFKVEVSATNTRKYQSVVFGTYECTFEIDGTPDERWVKKIERELLDQNHEFAFLDRFELRPIIKYPRSSHD